jgi:hypothetical protein
VLSWRNRKMEKGISEIIGRADVDGDESREVYRALRSLLCSTCGAEIMESALFTRRRVKGIGVSIMPQCRKCAPFILQASKQEKSALLRSLLTEPTPASSSTQTDSVTAANANAPEDVKNLDEEVRRRLGPALKRGRHKRSDR